MNSFSLEANHLIWEWIMNLKGPNNQADFIEVLYMKCTYSFTGPSNAQIFSLNNAEN